MKKIILVLAIISSTIETTKAQNNKSDKTSNFHIGIKAGLNVSNVYDTKGQDFVAKAKAGVALGIFTQIPIASIIGIQPEVLFSQKGFKATGTLLGSPYSYTRTTDYLDIPIFLAIKPVKVLTLLAGPQYSFLLKEKNVFDNSIYTTVQEQQFNNDNIRKNTLCLVGGADLNIEKLIISARAGWDVQNNAGDGTNNTPRYKNVWYQATIGYKF